VDLLTLVEHRPRPAVLLSLEQRDTLRRLLPSVAVSPTPGAEGCYDLTPGSTVGVLTLPGLAVEIRPKIDVSNVLFLLCYALDPSAWRSLPFAFGTVADSLPEAMAQAFLQLLRQALRRGVLQGYRNEEAALPGLRGRIRLDDHLRRRFGLMPPLEVRYDEYTEDIEPNRLLRAAIDRLERLLLRREDTRRALRQQRGTLERVTLRHYSPSQLPEIAWDRLNDHYRGAVELAKLILRAGAFDLAHGRVAASAFLLDMNEVFEVFVVTALRESLALGSRAFPRGAAGRSLCLDHGKAIGLEPDLSWWEGPSCVFVGDVKYKRTSAAGVKHPDLYQLLAYTVAAGLSSGLLIYAAGEGEPVAHEVVDVGKRIEVCSLDLGGPPASILAQINVLANQIRQLAANAVDVGCALQRRLMGQLPPTAC
jgi:5-methylcytosine-specific restriction enzyme subunit McrC